MRNLHASYWKSDGKDSSGKDCERYDPHGFGLDLIRFMVKLADPKCIDIRYSRRLTPYEIGQIQIKHHGVTREGYIVRVSAPLQIWAKAQQMLVFSSQCAIRNSQLSGNQEEQQSKVQCLNCEPRTATCE